VLARVAEEQLVVTGAASLDELGEALEQDGEPLLRLGMSAPGRMELGERRMR
jgi:hypothetical protein